MSTEDNKATVRRIIEEGWNQGEIAIFDALCASDWIHHDAIQPHVRTLEDFKSNVTERCGAFPDLHFEIEDMIAEGEQVVARDTHRGSREANDASACYWQADHRDSDHHLPLCCWEGC